MQGLNADIFIDGKKVAHVYDDAMGGEFDYDVYGSIGKDDKGEYQDSNERIENKKLFAELEAYIKTLPPKESTIKNDDGSMWMCPVDMDIFIDDIINEIESKKGVAKFKKKMEKDMVKGICWGTSDTYRQRGYKIPLAEIVKKDGGKMIVQKLVRQVKADLKEGEVILNTNLAELGIAI